MNIKRAGSIKVSLLTTTILLEGYYADPDTECQAFHVCTADGNGGLSKNSFLCPNGTIFNQNYFICDWWFNFDCSEASGKTIKRRIFSQSGNEFVLN
jgi:hypothetical protein